MTAHSEVTKKLGLDGLLSLTAEDSEKLAHACHTKDVNDILDAVAGILLCVNEMADANIFSMSALDSCMIRKRAEMEVKLGV